MLNVRMEVSGYRLVSAASDGGEGG
jgi:hypothetical protein